MMSVERDKSKAMRFRDGETAKKPVEITCKIILSMKSKH